MSRQQISPHDVSLMLSLPPYLPEIEVDCSEMKGQGEPIRKWPKPSSPQRWRRVCLCTVMKVFLFLGMMLSSLLECLWVCDLNRKSSNFSLAPNRLLIEQRQSNLSVLWPLRVTASLYSLGAMKTMIISCFDKLSFALYSNKKRWNIVELIILHVFMKVTTV